MKKVLVITLILYMGVLCGCGTDVMEHENTEVSVSAEDMVTETQEVTEEATVAENTPFKMECVGEDWKVALFYRNTVTDVLYLWGGNHAGFTEMSDPETGLPLTYTRYLEIFAKNQNAAKAWTPLTELQDGKK